MVQFVLPDLLTNIVAGLLIIVFGIIVGNIMSVLTRKILNSFETEHLLNKLGVQFPVVELIGSIVKYGLYLAGLVWGLTFLGLGRMVLYIILIGIICALILFILLALKDFIPNFIAGLYLFFKKKIKKGDLISIEGAEGKVVAIGLYETRVKMKDGDIVIIPNTFIVKNKVVIKKK